MAKKVDWDSNQKSRMRGMITFGIVLPIGCAIGAWLVLSADAQQDVTWRRACRALVAPGRLRF